MLGKRDMILLTIMLTNNSNINMQLTWVIMSTLSWSMPMTVLVTLIFKCPGDQPGADVGDQTEQKINKN